MRKTTKMKLSAILGAAAFLLVGGAFLATNETKATAEDATPTLTFKGANVVFEDGVHLMYAVDEENIAPEDVQVLIWNEAPEDAEYVYGSQQTILNMNRLSTAEQDEELGAGYPIYYYDELAAKQMTDVVYARAYANVDGVEYYSAPLKYSVLTYAYTKLGYIDANKKTTDENLLALLPAMLNYGAATQKYLNYKADRLAGDGFSYVKIANATFDDGFTSGLYYPGDTLNVTIAEGYKLSINADEDVFVKNVDGTVTLTVPNRNVITEGDVFIDQNVEESVEAKALATFEFGANGNAAHVDGSNLGTSKTYTDGNYELSLTAMSSVFGPAYDAKGNSCIKFGTSSKTGSLTFTVPDNVTSVILYVAKYKTNTTKITVNGTNYTLSKNSDNGEYDVIEVDTSETKTVTFATVSGGYRAMMNTIEFWA